MIKPKYKIGNIVTDGKFTMKIFEVIEDGGTYYYGCKPIEFRVTFARAIREDRLMLMKEVDG